MAKVVVKSKVKKAKRKFPVEVKAPQYLNSVSLGTSNVTDLSKLVGKTSKMNLMYVTGSSKNQNVRLTFRIEDVSSGLAKTQVKKYEQIPYYLGRFVKKGSDLIEDSFVVTTKDGYEVRFKPFVVTKMNATDLIASSLRSKVKEFIVEQANSQNYEELISGVINSRIQPVLRNELKGIFPIKALEFKKVELE